MSADQSKSEVTNSSLAPAQTVVDTSRGAQVNKQQKSSSSSLDAAASGDAIEQKYSLRTSAYLQNLAEICFTVLQDRRWRVGKSYEPLFRWEDGEDLSVVTALSRHFIPRQKPNVSSMIPCTCLLCRDQKKPAKYCTDETATESATPADDVASANASSSSSKPAPYFPPDQEKQEVVECGENESVSPSSENQDVDIEDSEEVRSLYLYCRLFYRKGPWFRIDDVYNRYYKPKVKRERPPQSSNEKHEESTADDLASTAAAVSSKNFFQPGKHTRAEASTKQSKNPASVIDKELLKQHTEKCLPSLISDLCSLFSCGLIRFFDDEEECGKTVGTTLLTADERNLVLSKLGAGKKRARRASNADNKENEVWKQMCRQKSIFTAQSNGNKTNLLPVQRHVDHVLLEKLAKSIVLACSQTEYIPAQMIRSSVQDVNSLIRKLIKEKLSSAGSQLQGMMCFRLRELPTRTLQRCARLYLCATSGPGEMRGNGTNGWRSLRDVKVANAPFASVIPTPCQQTWHQVQYPGLSHRFGLSSACFMRAYEPLLVCEPRQTYSIDSVEQVFSCREDFQCWELCVDLRANVDYLVELNETMRYEQRRQARGKEPRYGFVDASKSASVDFLDLLTENGQQGVLGKLLSENGDPQHVHLTVKQCIQECEPALEGECEKVLSIIGILAVHILSCCNLSLSHEEHKLIAQRPWLRHMSWYGCLAYVLWDIIPILERRGLYRQAVWALEVLLFGSASEHAESLHSQQTTELAPLLLSRRARGKALERLIIDYTHMHRQSQADAEKAEKRSNSETFQLEVACFSRQFIINNTPTSAISFSAVRSLARRLKRPLSKTLDTIDCLEARELGIRLGNADLDSRNQKPKNAKESSTKYSDWTPITDRSVANALDNDDSGAGARCAFVGFEDEGNGKVGPTSLNVEELAMELYQSGRLPEVVESAGPKGGWTGWHDEGGHVRALFRILCSAPVLGMDWGCFFHRLPDKEKQKQATVHLSPYQGAPFDLHVGYELKCSVSLNEMGSSTSNPTNGFFFRRSAAINAFLTELEQSSGQALCDLVYDSIFARLRYMNAHEQKDPFVDRDLMQIRTLSAVAAGFGGPQLAAIFRCFFFDYRHYSGGLPDLHLFRALYDESPHDKPSPFVDLGEWIGESYSIENQQKAQAQRGAAILSDRDDEFLGCSKVGDSGGLTGRSSRAGKQLSNSTNALTQSKIQSMNMLPERLQLVHNGRNVKVECMMVEVKSSNDRLDARQEDWLNVLDLRGNARVCKFIDTSKSRKKAAKKSASGVTDSISV